SDIVTFCQRVAPPRRNLCLRIAREPHRPRSDGPDARETKMTTLLMIIGFGAATSVVVGLGQRLRLPWPALMVLIGIAYGFTPNFDDITIEPELILSLFRPPLLFAAVQKTSWALFAIRWRTILGMAVAFVGVTAAAVAGSALLLIHGITI